MRCKTNTMVRNFTTTFMFAWRIANIWQILIFCSLRRRLLVYLFIFFLSFRILSFFLPCSLKNGLFVDRAFWRMFANVCIIFELWFAPRFSVRYIRVCAKVIVTYSQQCEVVAKAHTHKTIPSIRLQIASCSIFLQLFGAHTFSIYSALFFSSIYDWNERIKIHIWFHHQYTSAYCKI